MPRFTLICDHSNALDTHVVTHEFNAALLGDVLENFQMFLKGAGYCFDGTLDIIEDDSPTGVGPDMHSQFYFDTGRNR